MGRTAYVYNARLTGISRAKKRRQERRVENGYDKTRYVEQDKMASRTTPAEKSQELYQQSFELFLEFMEDNGYSRDSVTTGVTVPTLLELKQHMRWYANSSQGRLSARPTVSSTVNHAERVFAALALSCGSEIAFEDRCQVFKFIRTTMVEDGEISRVKRAKYNFTIKNFLHLHRCNWLLDDPVFVHGRVKAQMTFLYQIGLFSGARLGAYVPRHKDIFSKGIQYRVRRPLLILKAHHTTGHALIMKDVELVLMPVAGRDGSQWMVDSRLTQRHVKNNKDPENSVYSNIMGDDERLPYAATLLLLAFAFADRALWGFDGPDDLWQQQLPLDPAGQHQPVPLRWNDEVLKKPICRSITSNGVDPRRAFDKVSFSRFHGAFVRNAGFYETPTYHSIRRQVGKELNKRYKPEERSQVLNQDPEVYGRDYVAHTSSASVKDTMLGEEDRTDLLAYFQSFDQFLIHGLPRQLPSFEEQKVLRHPDLCALRAQIQLKSNLLESQSLKNELKNRETSMMKKALNDYQANWVSEYRKSTILTRGRSEATVPQIPLMSRTLGIIMPERARLAQTMTHLGSVSHSAKLSILKDLITFITRDYSVVYLPNEEPVDGRCPVMNCQSEILKFKKPQRSQHVHNCRKIEFASSQQCTAILSHYCYLDCFSWFVDGEEWEAHCQQHLNNLLTTQCGIVKYCNTLIRPAYCPQCLGNEQLKPSERLQQFLRDSDLINHLERDHMHDTVCSHPLCGYMFQNHDRTFHWSDQHGLNKNVWKRGETVEIAKQLRKEFQPVTNVTPDILGTKTLKSKDAMEFDAVKVGPSNSTQMKPLPRVWTRAHQQKPISSLSDVLRKENARIPRMPTRAQSSRQHASIGVSKRLSNPSKQRKSNRPIRSCRMKVTGALP